MHTHKHLPPQKTDPSNEALRLYLKFFFITEREYMLAYVHVEEEEGGDMLRRLRAVGGRSRSRSFSQQSAAASTAGAARERPLKGEEEDDDDNDDIGLGGEGALPPPPPPGYGRHE